MGFKLAIDLPINYTGTVGVGDICFVLANFVAEDSQMGDMYLMGIEQARRNKMPILLDNGAWEFGKSIGVANYIRIIKAIKPDYAIIPDVLYDTDATLEVANDFMDIWKQQSADVRSTILYFVPQGRTTTELVECLRSFFHNYWHQVPNIAIPKHCHKIANRVDITNMLYREVGPKFKKVHFLGYNGINEFTNKKRTAGWELVSLDTKWPFKQLLKVPPKSQTDYYETNEQVKLDDIQQRAMHFKRLLEYHVNEVNS